MSRLLSSLICFKSCQSSNFASNIYFNTIQSFSTSNALFKISKSELQYSPRKQFFKRFYQDIFNSSPAFLVLHYQGLTANEFTQLRIKLKSCQFQISVTKNRLVQLCLRNTTLENLRSLFMAPTALIFIPPSNWKTNISTDSSNIDLIENVRKLINVLLDFPQSKKLHLIGGMLDGYQHSRSSIKELLSLPSKERLQIDLTCLLSQHFSQFVQVLNSPSQQLLFVMNEMIKHPEDLKT